MEEIEEGYEGALKAAGARIHALKYFGSYQGDIWALVTYNGKQGWINLYYGSCSGCDSYENEFRYSSEKPRCDEHEYDDSIKDCPECAVKATAFKERLKIFGKSYLDHIMSKEEALKEASGDLDWDEEAQEMIDFINTESETSFGKRA